MPTFWVRNANNDGWINAATASGFRIRNADNSGWINKTSNMSGVAVRNANNDGWINFVTFAISPSTTVVQEGYSVTYTITTSGFGTGTLYWTNSGTTSGSDFSDGQNSGSISVVNNAGSFTRTLSDDFVSDGRETIIIQLRTGSTSGPVVATAATVTVIPASIKLYFNDLDFYYPPVVSSTSPSQYNSYFCVVDTTNFYSNGADHLVFALDCSGRSDAFGTNGTRDHEGPIIRNGDYLWDEARGFIIYGNGDVKAEHWYNGAGFGLLNITNTSGSTFNPASTPVFNVRIIAGYRSGMYANTMTITIRQGTAESGTVLFTGTAPGWGWDWTGSHKYAIAGIAGGFVPPGPSTSYVEPIQPRSAPNAVASFFNLNLTVV